MYLCLEAKETIPRFGFIAVLNSPSYFLRNPQQYNKILRHSGVYTKTEQNKIEGSKQKKGGGKCHIFVDEPRVSLVLLFLFLLAFLLSFWAFRNKGVSKTR
jgi:hypothetical protein